jgi:DNA replication ATP-dependent helicase Dna2
MNNNLLLCLKFDFCIMDEASQISEPMAIGPILLAQKFIMIGDYYQLNPLVKSYLAEKKGMGVSLFEKLCKKHPQSATVLKKQYRMNADILELSNSIIYHGVMTHGNPQVANQKVVFHKEVK